MFSSIGDLQFTNKNMSTSNLNDYDVNQLFKKSSINEIDAVYRNIENEIEVKKEELRTMVGSRYRDLLQAADTIAEMKVTASKIKTECIVEMMKFSEEFNQQQIIGAFNDLPSKRQTSKDHYGIVAQIKLLTIILEMIGLIDDSNILLATQLFIFSRHISTGLKLDANKAIMSKFPIAKKQWDLLAPYYGIIKQRCLLMLEEENISIECAVKCLASLTLLENNSQMDKLLNIFIQTRNKTFLKSIHNENFSNVKESLLTSINILYNTVEIIHECFLSSGENEKGLLFRELEKVCETTTITLVRHRSAKIFQKLPEIILKHKPQIQVNPVEQSSLDNAIKMWLQTIDAVSKNQLKLHIAFIVSIKTIQDIQKLVAKIEKPKNWNNICNKLFELENFDFYHRFYQPLINERIHTIINIAWNNILDEFHVEVEKIIEENDHDLRHYVWNEDALDNPLSLQAATNTNKRSHKLLMKVSAYSSSIIELCNKIDQHLELLFNELKQYLCESSNDMELKKMKENVSHRELVKFLTECSRENVQTLISIVKSFSKVKSSESCIVMARLLQSFTEICPNLQYCFSGHLLIEQPLLMRDPTQNAEGDEEWNKTCKLFVEESNNFWMLWVSSFVENWKPVKSKEDTFLILKDFPCWEKVNITERNENEEIIDSIIYVPVGISTSIQNWIFDITNHLNRIIPHTLPKTIHLVIINHLVTQLHAYYEGLTQTENQKVAWQFLFDLKVLLLLFVGRENKTMYEKYQQLISHFRGIIDPFDYDVFYKHVSVNIKKCAAKLQYIAGVLVPNMEYLNSIILANQTLQAHDKDPNILIMSHPPQSEHNWFQLLPIINTKDIPMPASAIMSTSQDLEYSKQKKNPSNKKQSSMHTSTSASALSSLQDWFR